MTAAEFAAFLARHGWTQVHAAKILGARQGHVSEWASGKRRVPPYVAAHCKTIDHHAATAAERDP